MTDPVLKKQASLQRLNDAEERWMKKLIRAANAISDIRSQKRRLLKPRKLAQGEMISGKDIHKIMDPEFFDDGEVLATL